MTLSVSILVQLAGLEGVAVRRYGMGLLLLLQRSSYCQSLSLEEGKETFKSLDVLHLKQRKTGVSDKLNRASLN